MEGEGVSAYAKTRQNLLYSLMQSIDEDEESNQNLDLESCQIRQLGDYLRMLNICDEYLNLRLWHTYIFLLILYIYVSIS